MTHELPSEGQIRQFNDALGREARARVAEGDLRRAKAVRAFMGQAARLHSRGLLTLEGFSFLGPEPEIEAITFTDEERAALFDVRATKPRCYLPTGETIRGQQGSRRIDVYSAGYTEEDGSNRLLDFSARRIEVAIWAHPEKPEEFFVPDSFGKSTDQQDKLMSKEADALRRIPGLRGVTIIRPEASEVIGVMFQHFDATGVRLLGEKWIDQNGNWRYIRTNTPTTKSGSHLAVVGDFRADLGPHVHGWLRDYSIADLGVAFWVVPNRFR